MAEFWRALRTLKALQAEQAAALEMSADREGAAERNPLTPPARIPPRRILRRRASGPNPNDPGPQARPDEPERAAVRRLACLRSEPGAAGRTLHEPAVPWLPKEPGSAFLSDAEPDRNTARPKGERKRPDPSACRAPNQPEADGAMKSPRALTTLRGTNEMALPDLARINRVLSENAAGFEIDPPNLISQNVLASIPVPERTLALDEQAQILIQKSLKDSEQLLSEGRYRQAVQEILWLLETVSTAFQGIDAGLGTIEGKYFNKIVQNLGKIHKGQTLEEVLSWMKALHGYLSSPTGGGIRHGTTLRTATAMHSNEARLFCNLIRSYITFLLAEHERLTSHS